MNLVAKFLGAWIVRRLCEAMLGAVIAYPVTLLMGVSSEQISQSYPLIAMFYSAIGLSVITGYFLAAGLIEIFIWRNNFSKVIDPLVHVLVVVLLILISRYVAWDVSFKWMFVIVFTAACAVAISNSIVVFAWPILKDRISKLFS